MAALTLFSLGGFPAAVKAQQADAPEPEPATTPSPAVAELIAARQDLQEFLFSLGDIDTNAFAESPQEQLAELGERLQPITEISENGSLDELTLDALLDLETELRTEISDLAALADTLQARAISRDNQLDGLQEQRTAWENLARTARERDAPAEVLALADGAAQSLRQAEAELKADRDAVLGMLSAVSDLQLDATAFGRELRGRRQSVEASSQRAAGLPLWRTALSISSRQRSDARATLEGYAESLRDYLQEHGLAVIAWFLAIGAITLWLLRASGAKVREFLATGETQVSGLAVFDRPTSAALLVALVGVLVFAPTGPVAFTDIVLALLPLPAAALAITVFAKPLRLSVYALAGALLVLAIRPFYDVLPLSSRLLPFLMNLAVAAAFYIDLRRGNWSQAFPTANRSRLRLGVLSLCVLLLIVLIIDALGFVGMATTLRMLVLGALGYGLIFLVLSYVLKSLALAMLQIRGLSGFSTVRHRPWVIVGFLKKAINVLAAIGWISATLATSGLASRVTGAIVSTLQFEFSVGAASVRVGSIVAGLLVIWFALSISRLIKFVMGSRALDYQSAASGLSFAVSKVLGYAVIVAGFFLALAAMGVDLTRVTVLAGALGVGIGLGLQNIANNFVSGIILLFERPIQVNDIAKVDDTMGTVKEIGIRSTVLQTFDGAEVIVPNADLMAKTVLNWTKSNRRRRVEIDVGVAYGTDTKQVIEILDKVAHAHEEALHDPEPLATFTGFGDSSLNFRLYVWLSDLANTLKTPSLMRQEILSELEKAGIEIPFPQRDIRVTMSAGESLASDADSPVSTVEDRQAVGADTGSRRQEATGFGRQTEESA